MKQFLVAVDSSPVLDPSVGEAGRDLFLRAIGEVKASARGKRSGSDMAIEAHYAPANPHSPRLRLLLKKKVRDVRQLQRALAISAKTGKVRTTGKGAAGLDNQTRQLRMRLLLKKKAREVRKLLAISGKVGQVRTPDHGASTKFQFKHSSPLTTGIN